MIGILFALLFAFLAPLSGTDAGLVTVPAEAPCTAVDANTLSDQALASMLEGGWAGDPDDGMEALYAPGCLASE